MQLPADAGFKHTESVKLFKALKLVERELRLRDSATVKALTHSTEGEAVKFGDCLFPREVRTQAYVCSKPLCQLERAGAPERPFSEGLHPAAQPAAKPAPMEMCACTWYSAIG